MIRRRFLGLMTAAGATGVGALSKASAMRRQATETVTYNVKGFTCITCATGLETLLGREKGIIAATATYPEGVATVRFDKRLTTEQNIQSTIESMGFTVRKLETKQG